MRGAYLDRWGRRVVNGNVAFAMEISKVRQLAALERAGIETPRTIAVDGEPPSLPQGWKDTWDVPPRSTVTVVSDLSNPGEWVYHCHILEHQDDGMMGIMLVE